MEKRESMLLENVGRSTEIKFLLYNLKILTVVKRKVKLLLGALIYQLWN